ncbi:cation-translocating P-type ATPase [Luteibacter yeojuensis]
MDLLVAGMTTMPPLPGRSDDPPCEIGGLDEDEARRRLERDGPNTWSTGRQHHWVRLLRDIVTEPMFLMLIVATGIYAILGDGGEAAFLGASVLIVIAITVTQEVRAQGALAALRELAAPLAHVLRSGTERRIPATEVVKGDTLMLREGDRVAADGDLIDGTVLVDESLLTGESIPVERISGGADVRVHAGTLVVGGHARIRVTATGERTALGSIGKSIVETGSLPSALQKAAGRIVRIFATIAIALAVLLWLVSWSWAGMAPLDAALTAVALAMAILPEEVPVVLAVFYALGARRIARHEVLTRRLAAVETMGTISLLAVDKTGTLTRNEMAVAALADVSGGVGMATEPLGEAMRSLISVAADACPRGSLDPTDRAILTFTRTHLHDRAASDEPFAWHEFPVAPGRPFVSRVFSGTVAGAWTIATKGAPEAVIGLCELDQETLSRALAEAAAMAARGLRVLAVAQAAVQGDAAPETVQSIRHRYVGLVALADPLRCDVPAAMTECRGAGIRVVMLTGDHPATAAAIAVQAGLRSDHLLTGAEIDRLDDETLAIRLRETEVCARVQPSQKLRLVAAFRKAGHVVGMTGDGVNDAPALRAADVGVAMGRRGSDVAREAADLVLLSDRFAALVSAIRLGRRVYDNVHRSMRFISAAHVPIVMLAIVPAVMQWSPLLLPVQIALVEMIIDPACSIVFEATPAARDIMRRPPRRPDESPFASRNVGTGLLEGAGIGALLVAAYGLMLSAGVPAPSARLAAFLGLLATTVVLVLAGGADTAAAAKRTPLSSMLVFLALSIAASVALIPPLRHILGFAGPSLLTLTVPVSCAAGAFLWLRFVNHLIHRYAPARVGQDPTQAPHPYREESES